MLVILKIPVVYLCAVVWWAIRAEPAPLEGAGRLAAVDGLGPRCDWRTRRTRTLRRGPRPRGGRGAPTRQRVARVAL
jgi:hypothetical protein